MVTEDLAKAERALDMVGHGRLITRRVTYGPWTSNHEGSQGGRGLAADDSLDG
jgi:hypothetical protein